MEKQRHLLSDPWESYPEAISNEFISQKKYSIMEHLTDILAIGPFYHYVINVGDYSLTQVSENAIHIHGFETRPTNLKEIIDQIHPDDLDFVLEAEEFTLRKMAEIGFEHQLNLKSSYCFRMWIADSTYRLFHHQAIHLNKDNQGRLLTALKSIQIYNTLLKSIIKSSLLQVLALGKITSKLTFPTKIKMLRYRHFQSVKWI